MKTPDEFAQVINRRKADPNRTVKRRKPAAIIVTIIFAAFLLVIGVVGTLRLPVLAGHTLHGVRSILVLAVALAPGLAIMGFAAATLFACFKRPRWGRPISMVFALAFSALMGYSVAFPDPHPLFPIAPGAEQAGAYAANVAIAFGIVAYVWSMVLGAKAKAYFAGD